MWARIHLYALWTDGETESMLRELEFTICDAQKEALTRSVGSITLAFHIFKTCWNYPTNNPGRLFIRPSDAQVTERHINLQAYFAPVDVVACK
jgi:hypothetical protein